jgi:ATP-dependent helicase/nuclease subunit B
VHNPRILTGTFDALEPRLLEMIAEQQATDPLAPVAILVGSNILASYLKSRIAAQGRGAANVRFHTFLDLAAKLSAGSRTGGSKRPLPHLGASLILEAALKERTPAPFARVAEYAGFRGALLDTFRDFRDAGILPAALESSLPNLQGITPDRREHLAGLVEIYRRFTARVAPFEAPADDFRRACAAASGAAKILGSRSLLIYGLYDVTGNQADLLRSLQDALDLTYFVPYSGESAAGFARPFLEARAKELGVAPVALPHPGRNDSLGRLAERVFAVSETRGDAPAQASLKADGSFALVSVPGESRMAIEVIREVLRAAREGVIAGFYEAAVVLRRPEEQAPVLAEAFRLRGIPYFLQGGSAFARRPLARAVRAIAALEAESFSRSAILTAMELIAAALPEAAATLWDVPRWRALANDTRLLAGADSWDAAVQAVRREKRSALSRAEAQPASDEEEDESSGRRLSIEQARRQAESAVALCDAWSALRRAAVGWPQAHTWQGWAKLLQERLEPLLGRSEDWSAFSIVFDTLAALGGLSSEAQEIPVTRGRISAALSEALADLSRAEGRFQQRGVNLLSVAGARGLRFPLVIVPGLEEGRFPARPRQDPLLLDEERKQIGRPPRLPLKSLRVEEEKLLFDIAVRSAKKRLVLMTSRLDEASDRERIPSQFFLRCAAVASGFAVSLADLTADCVPGLRSTSLDEPGHGKGQIAIDESEIRLGLITEDHARSRAALAAIAQAEPLLMNGSVAYDRARWTRKLTEFDGLIQDPALRQFVARKLQEGTEQLSASRIEEYARCPYMFYLRRAQGLERWEEEERIEGLDPLLRGQIVHSVLESFLREYSGERSIATPLPVLQKALAAQAGRALDEGRPTGMPDLLWEIDREKLMAMLRNWLEFERERASEGFRPEYLERSFGSFAAQTESPAYRVQGKGHVFDFRGRIDRIDVAPDGRRARVIDYKTGALPPNMVGGKRTLLMAGEKVQLAIYRGALSVMEDLRSVEQIEGEYLHLQPRDGSVVACAYSDSELRAAVERLPGVLEIVHEGIDGGVFFARASGSVRPEGHCDWCDYLPICGKDRERRQADKAADPAVARFDELQEIDGAAEEEEK